ncbi:MAG: DUF58 domain-containing protein [Elusimicrobiota bacterium]
MFAQFNTFIGKLFKTKRPFQLTRSGWVFILYTIGVGAGAINTGNNLLYIIFGIFLGLLLASGLLSDLSLWGIEINWEFPEVIQAQESALIPVRVINRKKRIPSLSIIVEFRGNLRGKNISFRSYISFIPQGQTISTFVPVLVNERGEFKLESVRIYTRFPFGLLLKWWTISRREDLIYVTPPITEEFSALDLFLFQIGNERDSDRSGDSGCSVVSLRSFHNGESVRKIHWKASSKRGQLMAKEFNLDEERKMILTIPSTQFPVDKKNDPEKFVEFVFNLILSCQKKKFSIYLSLAETGLTVKENLVFKFLSIYDPLNFNKKEVELFLEQKNLPSDVTSEINLYQLFQEFLDKKHE